MDVMMRFAGHRSQLNEGCNLVDSLDVSTTKVAETPENPERSTEERPHADEDRLGGAQ